MSRFAALAFAASLLLAAGCSPDSGRSTTADHDDSNAMGDHAMSAGSMESDMTTMNDRMVGALGAADSSYDDRFIDMMIPHHQGAIAMARDARTKAQHPELRALADSIIAAQEQEIHRMEEWRREWYAH